MENKEITKELQVLDEMGKEVRKLTVFEETVEGLKGMVAESQKIVVSDLEDKNQLETVKRSHIDLRNVEIAIEKRGKGYRDVFNAVNKEISDKEKMLKKITSPEINRLKAIEEEAEKVALIKKRMALLPVRKERLAGISDFHDYVVEDKLLLDLNADSFERYYNACVADENERVRIKQEQDAEAERKAEADKLAKERAEMEESRAKANRLIMEANAKLKEEQDKIAEANRKLEADRLALKHAEELREAEVEAKKKAEEDLRLAGEREKAEQKRVEEEEKKRKEEMEKKEAFKEFLRANGWTQESRDDFKTKEVEGGYELWKKIAFFGK